MKGLQFPLPHGQVLTQPIILILSQNFLKFVRIIGFLMIL